MNRVSGPESAAWAIPNDALMSKGRKYEYPVEKPRWVD